MVEVVSCECLCKYENMFVFKKNAKCINLKICICSSSRKRFPFNVAEMAEKCCILVEDERSTCLQIQVGRQVST